MTIDPLSMASAQAAVPVAWADATQTPWAEVSQAPRADAAASPANFADWLSDQVRGVNTDLIAADDSIRRLAVGDPVNLHQVMVNLERAKLRFELVLQVRNKLLEAYQDLMRMQV